MKHDLVVDKKSKNLKGLIRANDFISDGLYVRVAQLVKSAELTSSSDDADKI